MKMKRLFAVVLLSVGAAQASDPTVHPYQLDNGLKLIVKEDHRAPVVVSQVWYKVGSSYEHEGITGISHVLEHMMFKGTKKHGPGEFSRIIAENGGQENAFTSRDYTAYFQRLEQSRLPVSFELEADRMRNLLLQEDEFVKEVQVVMEERRLRTEDKPESLLFERFNAVAFINSPSRIPPIGWMTDLESLRLDDLAQWYATWYAPNNATLVVAGDVDPDEVLKLAKRFFGPLKPSEIRPEKPRREVPQRGTRRGMLRAPAEVAYVLLGYKAPVLLTAGEGEDWEPYALEVLAGVLDGGDSARLTRELVRGQQIAASAGAGYDLYDRRETLLLFDGVPAKGHTVAELEVALREQVRRLREEPVSAAELERVKAQVIASQVFEQDSVFYQAMQIGQLESIGLDWSLKDAYLKRIQAISSEQVQAVARKYLFEDALTVGILEPLPMDAAATAAMRRAEALGGGHGH